DPAQSPWHASQRILTNCETVDLQLRASHLAFPSDAALRGTLPIPRAKTPLILGRSVPAWLYAGFARTYAARGVTVGVAVPQDNPPCAVLLTDPRRGEALAWQPPV